MIKSSFEWQWQQEQARKARIEKNAVSPLVAAAYGALDHHAHANEGNPNASPNVDSAWHEHYHHDNWPDCHPGEPGCSEDRDEAPQVADRADPDVEKAQLGTPSADRMKMVREAYGDYDVVSDGDLMRFYFYDENENKTVDGLHDGTFPDPGSVSPGDGFRVADEPMGSAGTSFDRPPLRQAGQSEALKGVKRRLRDLENRFQELHDSFTGVQESVPDYEPPEDGVSNRPCHDPSVPYEDMPGDEVQSLPFASTAPVEASKVNHFDLPPLAGTGHRPGDNLPPKPAQETSPDRSPAPRPGAPGYEQRFTSFDSRNEDGSRRGMYDPPNSGLDGWYPVREGGPADDLQSGNPYSRKARMQAQRGPASAPKPAPQTPPDRSPAPRPGAPGRSVSAAQLNSLRRENP